MKKFLFWILIIFIFIGNASLLFFENSIDNYFYSISITSLFYLLLILLLRKTELSSKNIFAVIMVIFVLKILAIDIAPIGTDDHYRYLWDGKVITNGINPFKYTPNSPELNHLHSDLLPSAVSYNHLKTIYFPLSQAAFTFAYFISGESIIGLKIILLITDLLITVGLFLLLTKFKINLKYSLIYILSPLIFYQYFIDAHIDLLGIMFFLFAMYFKNDKKVFAALLLGASLAVKPTFLIALPIFFFYERGLKNKIVWATIPIIFLVITFIPFAIDTNPFDSLMNYTKNWVFNGAGFNFLALFLDVNSTIRIALLLIFVLIYLLILIFNRSVLSSIYYSMIALFLLSPVVHPWYITWLIIPLILNFRMSGIVFLSTIALSFYTVLVYQKSGVWQDYNLVLFLEYIPVIVLLCYEFYKSEFFKKKFTQI